MVLTVQRPLQALPSGLGLGSQEPSSFLSGSPGPGPAFCRDALPQCALLHFLPVSVQVSLLTEDLAHPGPAITSTPSSCLVSFVVLITLRNDRFVVYSLFSPLEYEPNEVRGSTLFPSVRITPNTGRPRAGHES